jgi:hypothetical protein
VARAAEQGPAVRLVSSASLDDARAAHARGNSGGRAS